MIVNFGESDMVGQQFTYALVHRLSTRVCTMVWVRSAAVKSALWIDVARLTDDIVGRHAWL
jgi:hypothetical protein